VHEFVDVDRVRVPVNPALQLDVCEPGVCVQVGGKTHPLLLTDTLTIGLPIGDGQLHVEVDITEPVYAGFP